VVGPIAQVLQTEIGIVGRALFAGKIGEKALNARLMPGAITRDAGKTRDPTLMG